MKAEQLDASCKEEIITWRLLILKPKNVNKNEKVCARSLI
jgi:hypothetical protein